MSQNIISGIGNYIKAEALYYAKVSPLRKTGSLNDTEAEKLFEGIRIIPRVAYNKNGMSIRDYANSKGEKGTYVGDLKIYAQPHAKKTKTSDGRMTHWDPDVQI
jgi:formamidopyrimidine-DNA glycosylase